MGKYLVLGSNSFSGSNFCSWLVNHGHHVFATSRSSEAAYEFLPYRWKNANPENFTFAKIDLNHDIGELKKIVHSFRPQYIVNLPLNRWLLKVGITPNIGWRQMFLL